MQTLNGKVTMANFIEFFQAAKDIAAVSKSAGSAKNNKLYPQLFGAWNTSLNGTENLSTEYLTQVRDQAVAFLKAYKAKLQPVSVALLSNLAEMTIESNNKAG